MSVYIEVLAAYIVDYIAELVGFDEYRAQYALLRLIGDGQLTVKIIHYGIIRFFVFFGLRFNYLKITTLILPEISA